MAPEAGPSRPCGDYRMGLACHAMKFSLPHLLFSDILNFQISLPDTVLGCCAQYCSCMIDVHLRLWHRLSSVPVPLLTEPRILHISGYCSLMMSELRQVLQLAGLRFVRPLEKIFDNKIVEIQSLESWRSEALMYKTCSQREELVIW